MIGFNIYKCKDGGYIVTEARGFEIEGRYQGPLFASTEIALALDYIRKQLEKAP